MTRRRVLFVGRTRYELPLADWLAKKWDAVEERLDYRLLGAATAGSAPSDERFRLARPVRPAALDALAFYLRLPLRVRNQIRTFAPDAIIASDPIVGAAALAGRRIAGSRTPVIVEVHGDWRTFTRSYGSRARRLVTGVVDRLAEWAVRRADATRAVSSFTGELVEQVRGEPPTVDVHGVQRPRRLHRTTGGAAAGAAGGDLRRRARALQERRGTGERVARAGTPPSRGAAGDRRPGLAARRGRAVAARLSRSSRPPSLARPRRASPRRSTVRRCSCCRRGRRASGAS